MGTCSETARSDEPREALCVQESCGWQPGARQGHQRGTPIAPQGHGRRTPSSPAAACSRRSRACRNRPYAGSPFTHHRAATVIARAGEEPLEVAEVAVDAAEIDPRTPSTMASSSSVSSSRQPQPFPAGSGLQAEQPQRRAGVALGPAEGERAADDLVPRGCDEHDRAVLGTRRASSTQRRSRWVMGGVSCAPSRSNALASSSRDATGRTRCATAAGRGGHALPGRGLRTGRGHAAHGRAGGYLRPGDRGGRRRPARSSSATPSDHMRDLPPRGPLTTPRRIGQKSKDSNSTKKSLGAPETPAQTPVRVIRRQLAPAPPSQTQNSLPSGFDSEGPSKSVQSA